MTTTVADTHRDLLDSPFATFGTIGPDGRPQLSEIWFLADGDDIRLSFNATRQKTKNLATNPAATLFILDLANPMRYLEIRGDAHITPDPDYTFANQLAAKYGDSIDLREMDGPGQTRVTVTLHPTHVVAVDMAAE
jgi:PPOX class probable F420-dependent enzyme